MFFNTNISFLGDFFDPIKAGNFHSKALDLMILPKKSTFNRLSAKAARQNPLLFGPFGFAQEPLVEP
jgi:hypothetical protein